MHSRHNGYFLGLLLTGILAGSSHGAEFNMGVTSDGINVGEYVSGPKLTTASFKGKVVMLEFWGIS